LIEQSFVSLFDIFELVRSLVLGLLSTFAFLFGFVFAVLIKNLLHILDCLLISVIEDLLSSSSNDFLEHLLLFFEKEFEPEALALWDDFDGHVLVNILVLLLDEGAEAFGLVVEAKLPSNCFENMVNLLHEYENYTKYNEIKERKLNDQEKEVN